MSFSLTKWYFDVVTERGDFAIAYWGEVRWGRLRPHFSAVQLGGREHGPMPWRTSAQEVGPPCVEEGIRWHADPIDLLVQGRRCAPSVTHELLATPQGKVTWSAEFPRATMRVHCGDQLLEGLGYAERLDLTLLPWRIPADTIRWGRFIAPDASLIWIEWQGDHPLSLLIRDGVTIDAGVITEQVVRATDGTTLTLTEAQLLTDERASGLLAPLEILKTIMSPIGQLHQRRWLSRGTLQRPGWPPCSGWVIHKFVEWR